jgi:uncharacterized protein (DUF362 family)
MRRHTVAIVRYEAPRESVRRAVALAGGLDRLPAGGRVFIKPNIVFWTRSVDFPKFGVITTSRVIADLVELLKERGIDDITIGEGMVTADPRDTATPAHAFESLGYRELQRRYGVRCIDVMQRPFETIDLGDGMHLAFNQDILHSDFVVNVPVMKAHNQTVVSLGIKNLKGTIDIASRKRCHSADPRCDLHRWIARLAEPMPPMLTLYDGIFTNERGPGFDGRMHRSDIVMAASDMLSGDLVGARVLGHDPAAVPHLAHAAANHGRPLDLSDVQVVGEPIADVARFHAFDFDYSDSSGGSLPAPLAKQGIRGISYRKYDSSMCTYCSAINGLILSAIRLAWRGEPFGDVEVLTGKMMTPTPGHRKTLLLGKCIYQAHRRHPAIREMIAVKSCPPRPKDVVAAFHQAGIALDGSLFENLDRLPGLFLERYRGKAEFDPGFFTVKES